MKRCPPRSKARSVGTSRYANQPIRLTEFLVETLGNDEVNDLAARQECGVQGSVDLGIRAKRRIQRDVGCFRSEQCQVNAASRSAEIVFTRGDRRGVFETRGDRRPRPGSFGRQRRRLRGRPRRHRSEQTADRRQNGQRAKRGASKKRVAWGGGFISSLRNSGQCKCDVSSRVGRRRRSESNSGSTKLIGNAQNALATSVSRHFETFTCSGFAHRKSHIPGRCSVLH